MRPKQRAALKKFFRLPPTHSPPDKILLRLWSKNFLIDIQKYTDICFQSASRMQFLGVQKWRSANVFSKTKQKYVCWKSQKGFSQCCQSILFSMSSENFNVEVRKTSEVFRVKLYCETSHLFRQFLLALRLSARKSEIQKKKRKKENCLIMSTRTCA